MARQIGRFLGACLALLSCAEPARRVPAATGPAGRSVEQPAPHSGSSLSSEPLPAPSAEPSATPARFLELEVPGHRAAMVFVPAERGERVPLLIAAHGAGDSAQWQCRIWREIVRERALVLCPAGVPLGPGAEPPSFYRNHHELEREVLEAVSAAQTAFADRLQPGAMVYTGYSQGATMGALMLPKHAALFPLLVMVEGGHSEWNRPIARRFKQNGGKAVLFVCGGRFCSTRAARSARYLTEAGVEARLEHVEGAGHTYDGPIAARVQELLPDLLARAGITRLGTAP